MLDIGEHTEGRLTLPSPDSTGHYLMQNSGFCFDVRELIDYIGVLEDYIGDEHVGVWKDLDLKYKVWRRL